MKRTIKSTLLGISVLLVSSLSAQQPMDEIKIIQGLYGVEKREIIKQYYKLTDEESKKFWPFYDQYEAERQKLGSDRLTIINEYAAAYENLKPEQADKLVLRVFDNDLALDKLNKKQYTKLKGELGAVKAASFFQLESYLKTMVQSEIQDNIPFIAELDHTAKK